jgi:hypothetical protein
MTPKIKSLTLHVMLFIFVLGSSKSVTAQINLSKESYFFFEVTDNDEKKVFYSSEIFYDSYEKCGYDSKFIADARRAFSLYLAKNYPDQFPNELVGVSHAKAIYRKSPSEPLKSKQDVQVKLLEQQKIQERINRTTVITTFSYFCD